MFNIDPSEMLVIVIVAIVVIGPKDLPLALRTAGRWIGKMRRVSNHFKAGLETMIREAELAEMEKKWQEQNAKIMAESAAAQAAAAEGQTPAHAADQLMHPIDPALAAHAPTEPLLPPPAEPQPAPVEADKHPASAPAAAHSSHDVTP